MNEPEPTVEETTEAVEPPEPAVEEHQEEKPASREARQRVELKETKARLERMQRNEVERLAASHLASATDLWLTGTTIEALLNDGGDVDPAKVEQACAEAVQSKPHWAATKPTMPRPAGLKSGAQSGPLAQPRSWADALRQTGG